MSEATPLPFACRCLLKPIRHDGFSPAGLLALTGARKTVPHRLDFARPQVTRFRSEAVDKFSFSGVQDKIPVRLERGVLAPAATGSQYILKPIPGTPLPEFTGEVPANEHLTMQVASQVFGIATAPCALVELADGEPAYLTRRFDLREDGTHLALEDFCVLAGRSPETHGRNFKYDGSCEEMAALLRRHAPAYAVEAEKLFRLFVFNYAFGNGDAHLKNFSLIRGPGGDPVLAPAYDLLCTHLHLPTETPLALDLLADDAFTPRFEELGFFCATDFLELAKRMGLREERAGRILAAFTASANAAKVETLAARSFLSPVARERYLAIVGGRRRALGMR